MTGKEYREMLEIRKKIKNLDEDRLLRLVKRFEKLFEEEEDLEALKVIREEIIRVSSEDEELKTQYKELKDKLYSDCKHEIYGSLFDDSSYNCMICGSYAYSLDEETTKKYVFQFDDYDAEEIVAKKVEEYVMADKPINQAFIDDVFKDKTVKMKTRYYRGK